MGEGPVLYKSYKIVKPFVSSKATQTEKDLERAQSKYQLKPHKGGKKRVGSIRRNHESMSRNSVKNLWSLTNVCYLRAYVGHTRSGLEVLHFVKVPPVRQPVASVIIC